MLLLLLTEYHKYCLQSNNTSIKPKSDKSEINIYYLVLLTNKRPIN